MLSRHVKYLGMYMKCLKHKKKLAILTIIMCGCLAVVVCGTPNFELILQEMFNFITIIMTIQVVCDT